LATVLINWQTPLIILINYLTLWWLARWLRSTKLINVRPS